MTYKNTLISLAMLGVIALIAVITLSYRTHTTEVISTALIPDGFMEDMHVVILDKQGKPSMKIAAPKMVHYAENDMSQLTNPQLTIYRKSPQPWFITSKNAKATQGIDHVDFWDDVVIHHAADSASPATVIKTPSLTVHTNAETAETKDPITMIQPNIIVQATGMFADMNANSIKLLSEAHGEYVPNS